jgi:hypothetical protein
MNTYAHLWKYIVWLFLEWKLFKQRCRENQKTHYIFNNSLSWKSCRLWDNGESYGKATQITDDKIIRHMRFACWIIRATNTHSEYVILIAFPLQQWFRELASMLRSSAHCLSVPHNLVMMLYDCHNQQRLLFCTDFTYRFFKGKDKGFSVRYVWNL